MAEPYSKYVHTGNAKEKDFFDDDDENEGVSVVIMFHC